MAPATDQLATVSGAVDGGGLMAKRTGDNGRLLEWSDKSPPENKSNRTGDSRHQGQGAMGNPVFICDPAKKCTADSRGNDQHLAERDLHSNRTSRPVKLWIRFKLRPTLFHLGAVFIMTSEKEQKQVEERLGNLTCDRINHLIFCLFSSPGGSLLVRTR